MATLLEAPGPGWCLASDENGNDTWVPSWPDSPCSEPIEEPTTARRPGGRMLAVAAYVAAHPGVCKREAAEGAGITCHEYGGAWGPVDRAIRAGLIMCDWAHPRRARLFRTVEDLRAFYGHTADDGYWHSPAHP